MTEHDEDGESAQVYHGKQDFLQKEARLHQYPIYASSNDLSLPTLTAKKFKDTKMSQQYKNYVMSQSQQEDVLHSLSDGRNDTLFVVKGKGILTKHVMKYTLLQMRCVH
ncbi:uncharacterized protein LOC136076889 [Hydra vulgaris]|uniref:Uncharacterized protein LOC136076889 n=1 Tax=Hydra vulgaris TaxID=6087 RepID=A0ABM4BCR1_HYDVU